MAMTVKEYCEKKVQELKAAGCKNITIGKVDEVTLGKGGMISYELFTAKAVPDTAEVSETWDRTKDCKGAQARIELVKPRCRKPERRYFYAALVQQG